MIRKLTRVLRLLVVVALLTSGNIFAGPKLHRVFFSYDASNGLADNSAQTIKCTRTGRMVISTIGHINFYDGDRFTHIDPKPEDAYPLPRYKGHYHLYFDRFHHIWLKDRGMVTCLDLMTERFVSNVDSVMKGMGMKHSVEDLFSDVNSHLWLLSEKHLYGVDEQKQIPVHLKVELQDVDVYQGKLQLQFFANSTVSVYEIKTQRHLFDATALEPDEAALYTRSSVIYPDSNVYYQIRNGDKGAVLLSFDIETRKWKKLMETPYHLNNMVRHNSFLFVASEYGYWTYNVNTGETEHIEELMLTRGRKLKTDINDICFDRQGGMWLGTENRGLLYSRPYKIPFVPYTWNDPEAVRYAQMMDDELEQQELPRHVNCKYIDSRGWVWTGTYTGLQLVKPGSMMIRTFTREDGLLNEMVHSVIEDNQHNMWVATSYGISRLFIRADSVHYIETYTGSDNVPNESFVNGRAIKLGDGTIVMQSLDHVIAFHPSNFYEIELSQMHLYPKLIRLLVNGHFVNAGTVLDGRKILDRAITRAKELTVNYNQNTLSLTFSGLNYMRPSQTYYRVRVKGLGNKWRVLSYANSDGLVDSRGMLHLPMTALRPGSYQVELQASMSPDVWPTEPLTWLVRVEEPWWRSTGIYILLSSVILLMLLANLIFMLRNTRLRTIRNAEEDDLLHRIKSFAERCDSLSGDVLTPMAISADDKGDVQNALENEFEDAMLQILPHMNVNYSERVNMRQLAALAGVELERLYELMSVNLYRSPRQLALKVRLQEAANALLQSDMTIEEISEKYRFVTTNFFIASFYHRYRKTPQHYRNIMPR